MTYLDIFLPVLTYVNLKPGAEPALCCT